MVSKNRPLSSACCSSLPFSGCIHGEIPRLLSPQGTSLKSFSVNFHPLPNSDNPFLPPTPQWRICARSLCPPLTSFFFSTAPSPADSMQRMQIHVLLFGSSLPWMNATLNEDTHFAEGAVKHAHKTVGGFFARSLSDMLSLQRWHEPTLFWASADPDRWRERKDQRRVALATELLFNLRNTLQRWTCGPLLEKPALFPSVDAELKRKSKLVEGWEVFIHLMKKLKM